ncbi:MAG: glycosyl-4,4'-diaponeurosporenoate acyltransferase [Clostridiales bacterium]|nr:glycosyl-4,4'-diaponeurosporenoate acyltransferase [Clostridiales bacterium]
MYFTKCILYYIIIGVLFFLIGRILPKRWFVCDKPPFRTLHAEKNGKLYETIRIRKWKDILPDMSKIAPGIMPPKRITPDDNEDTLYLKIQETCIAEAIHILLCIFGFGCLRIWPGAGGLIMSLLFAVGNLPFILVQRYNRPRMTRACEKLLQSREKAAESKTAEKFS